MYQRIPVRILCDCPSVRPSRGGRRIRWLIDMLSCCAANCPSSECRPAIVADPQRRGKNASKRRCRRRRLCIRERASGSPGSILVRRKMGHSLPPSLARKHKRKEGAPKVHSQVKAESDNPIAVLIIKATSKLRLRKYLLVSLKKHRNPRGAMKSSRGRYIRRPRSLRLELNA